MATFTRANAWNNGGTFANDALLWYAKGVAGMQARQLDDPSSWWFFAAIHGQYVTETEFPGWGFVPAPPSVPTTPQPSKIVADKYWDQCQHQTWYFLPWHRGYLIALEAQVRAEVVKCGGPSEWALPYWNYFGSGSESDIPPAFTVKTLPDGSENPLLVTARYGPNQDGTIFVPIPPVNDNCMSNDLYTGSDASTPPPGFGGPSTGFSHSGGASGNAESNPHNLVHVFVGSEAPSGIPWGLMSDPGLAALDPIFYLHHANIDRMWAEWNVNNANPQDSTWLDGPAAIGEREFVMPMPDGTEWVYTPQDMTDLASLDYTYDSLAAVPPAPAAAALAARLTRLGARPAATARTGGVPVATSRTELLGTSEGPVPITGAGVSTAVKLDPATRQKVSASLTAASAAAPPDRVFLSLENVRGTRDASVLDVYIDLPEFAANRQQGFAGSVGLFGLRRATQTDREHGGQGLSFMLDITGIVDALHLSNALDLETLPVRIVPNRPVPEQAQITVGRIRVYRQESKGR